MRRKRSGFARRIGLRSCLALSLGAALSLACSSESPADGGGDVGGADDDVYDAVLFDHTVVLDDESLGALTADDADLTLHFTGTPASLAGLGRGQVLLGAESTAAPSGLLRLVTEVGTDADGLVVHTMYAPLQLAFEHLDLSVARDVEPQPFDATLRPLSVGGAFPEKTLDYFAYNGDGDPSTTDDQVHIGGHLKGGFSYTLGFSVDWGDVASGVSDAIDCVLKVFSDCDPVSLLPEIKVGFGASAGLDAELDMEGVAFLDYDDPSTIATVPLDKIFVGPLVFFPEVEVIADIQGDAASRFALGSTAKAYVGAELSYSSKHGGTMQPPKVTTPTFSVLRAEPVLSARTRVKVGPRLNVRLYNLFGPYASFFGYAELDADRTRTPCYELHAGLTADLGLSLAIDTPVYTLTLPSYGETFQLLDETVDTGSCPPLSAGEAATVEEAFANPQFTPWSASYGDTLSWYPPESSGAQVEWTSVTPTIDGRHLLTGSSVQTATKIDDAGNVVWAREYLWPDAWSDVASQSELWVDGAVPTLDTGTLLTAFPFTLIKTDAAGGVSWARRFPLAQSQEWLRFTGVAERPSGGFLLSANYLEDRAQTTGEVRTWLLGVDAAGNLETSTLVGDSSAGVVSRGLVPLPDGVVVFGSTYEPTRAFWTPWVVRLDLQGQVVWARTVEVSSGGQAARAHILSGFVADDGDLVLGGWAQVQVENAMVLKMKPDDGSVAWTTLQTCPDAYIGIEMTALRGLPTSGMIAAGNFTRPGFATLWVGGVDGVGRLQWLQTYEQADAPATVPIEASDHPGLEIMRDGSVVVAGYTRGLASGTSPDGDGLWAMKVAAKDGAIAFGRSDVTMTSHDVTTTTGSATATPWDPPLASLDVTSDAVDVTSRLVSTPVTELSAP